MNKTDALKLSIKSLCSDKTNIILIILLTICSTIIIFGISYYISIRNFWDDWLNNSYDFRLHLVIYDSEITNQKQLIKQLEKQKLDDIFTYPEYSVFGYAVDFQKDSIDGETQIIGTVPNTKKIILGRDLNANSYEIICPSNFLPRSNIQNQGYDSSLEINMSNYLNKKLTLSLFSLNDTDNKVDFKIVGLYDEGYDYSDTNVCYTTHETIKSINEIYQPSLFEGDYPIYILINESTNLDEIHNIQGVEDVVPMKTIKTSVGDDILKVTLILLYVSVVTSLIILILTFKKRFENKFREYGLMLALGYTRKDLKIINLFESIEIFDLSLVLSIFILYILTYIFPTLILKNDMQLSKLNINIEFIPLIISIAVSFAILFLINISIIRKLKKQSIKNTIGE